MAQEKKLSLSFGGFDCEIVGYDDPLDLLGRIIETFSKTAEGRAWLDAGDMARGDEKRRRFADRLAASPEFGDADISAREGRLAFVRRECAQVDPNRSRTVKAPPGIAEEFRTMRALLAESDQAAERVQRERPRSRVVRAAPEGRATGAGKPAPETRDSPPFTERAGDDPPTPDDTLVLTEADFVTLKRGGATRATAPRTRGEEIA